MVKRNPLSFLIIASSISYMIQYENSSVLGNPYFPLDKLNRKNEGILKRTLPRERYLDKINLEIIDQEKKINLEIIDQKIFQPFILFLCKNLRNNKELTKKDIETIQKTDPEVILSLIELMLHSTQKTYTINAGIFLLRNSPEIKISNMSKMASFMKILGVKNFYRSNLLKKDLIIALSKSILFYPFITMLPLSKEESTIIMGDDSNKMILECLEKIANESREIIESGTKIKNNIQKSGFAENKMKLKNALKEIYENNK